MGKRVRKYVTIALASVMALSVVGCDLVERTEESKGKTVLAKIGKKKITKDDLDKELKTYLDQYKEQYGDDFETNDSLKDNLKQMRKQKLDQLVTNEVLMQSKESLDVNPSEDEVNTELDERISHYKESCGSDDEYVKFIESYGYDEDSFEKMMKEGIVLEKVYEALFKDIEVSDDEVEKYYNDNKDQYVAKPGADVTHLLFQPEKDSSGNVVAGGDEAAKALADKAREQAAAGKSLQDLAMADEFKDKCKFEDLGRVNFENSGMVKEFEDAFKVLPAKQVSEVVKTSFGYHIIINNNVYTTEEIKPLNDDLKEEIKSNVLNQKQQDEYEPRIQKLKDDIGVEVYEDKL
ncbi:MAG: hypothetical protein E7214_05340 [Clostridium sp.]|nr:hypothetical protein [Clostridium sp.]